MLPVSMFACQYYCLAPIRSLITSGRPMTNCIYMTINNT